MSGFCVEAMEGVQLTFIHARCYHRRRLDSISGLHSFYPKVSIKVHEQSIHVMIFDRNDYFGT